MMSRRTVNVQDGTTQREVFQCMGSCSVCQYLFARVSPLEADTRVELGPHCAIQDQLLSHEQLHGFLGVQLDVVQLTP